MTTNNNFEKRKEEIDEYFAFLSILDQDKLKMSYEMFEEGAELPVSKSYAFDENLIKILKANGYLLLYNLIEATIKEALWEVLEQIDNKLSYHEVSTKIQTIWREEQAFYHRDITKDKIENLIQKTIQWVSGKIRFKEDYLTKQQLAGNIDMKKIIKLSDQFGFEKPSNIGTYQNHVDKIKNNRNDLAHGNLFFTEIGKDNTVSELIKMKDDIFLLLDNIRLNITRFIEEERFKNQIVNS